MDLAARLILYILIANVGYMIFSLVRRGVRAFGGYILQLSALLVVMLLLVARGEDGAWAVGLSLAGVFLLVGLPLLLQKQIERLVADQRLAEIEPLARWKARLAWSDVNAHLETIARITASAPDAVAGHETAAALKALLGKGEPYDGMTRVFLAMVLFQGRRFEQLLRDLVVPDRPFDDYPFEELLYVVRGFLETGQYESAVQAQMALERKALDDGGNDELYGNLVVCRLIFFAFMGWEVEFAALADSPDPVVQGLPAALRKYWYGFSCFNAGQFTKGETLMQEGLEEAAEELPAHWLQWMASRLQGLREGKEFHHTAIVPSLNELRARYQPTFHQLIQKATEAARPPEMRDRVTTGLIMAILLVYVLTAWIFGDINDLIDLLGFGANSGLLVRQGEWFRLFTYQFLHLGSVHLVMNVIALRYFGPPLETLLGPALFLGLFLWSGVTGGLATVQGPAGLSVGASAAIAGLLGAALAFELLGDRRQKVLGGQNYLATLVFIIIINLLIGLIEKGIDNRAHVGGFAGGLVAGIVLVMVHGRPLATKVAELVAMVFVIALFGLSSRQFHEARTSGGYPPREARLQGTVPAAWPVHLSIPAGWEVLTGTKGSRARALQGPLGERIDLIVVANTDPEEQVLKEYLDERTRSLVESAALEFRSRLGPYERNYGNKQLHEVKWRLALEGRKLTQRDFLWFGPGRLLLLQCILPTHHDDRYDPVLQAMLETLTWK